MKKNSHFSLIWRPHVDVVDLVSWWLSMSAARIEAVEKHIRWQHMEDAIFIWVENCDSS